MEPHKETGGMRLIAGRFQFDFPRPALVMGIVNVTPDSFSDGGTCFDTQSAVTRALELQAQGAEIIDIGGESTRPGATPVSEEEELRRVVPVIEQLAPQLQVPISIDTMKPAVAKAALEAGASIVNDVGANRNEPEMWRLVSETGAGYVCMHMQGRPQTMQVRPYYEDVVREVREFFIERLKQLSHCGVREEQVIIDPGIGFGKTMEHNLLLLGGLRRFTALGRPVLLGVSRKSFLGKVTGAGGSSSLSAGLACTSLARGAGVQLFRTHDVAPTVHALRMVEGILDKS